MQLTCCLTNINRILIANIMLKLILCYLFFLKGAFEITRLSRFILKQDADRFLSTLKDTVYFINMC